MGSSMVPDLPADEKADQLERDFGVPNPLKQLHAGLRRETDKDVTPFEAWVGQDRIAELVGRGFTVEDASIVLLMRGARREVLAVACGYRFGYKINQVGEFLADVRARMRQI